MEQGTVFIKNWLFPFCNRIRYRNRRPVALSVPGGEVRRGIFVLFYILIIFGIAIPFVLEMALGDASRRAVGARKLGRGSRGS